MKVFRIIPEFKILRLTFHKSQPQKLDYDIFDLILDLLKTIDH